MLEPEAFQALSNCVCAGDDAAATESVRRYEPMVRRVEGGGAEAEAVAERGASSSRQVLVRELLDEARARFSDNERRLLDRRQNGANWVAIAAAEGASPEALHKKFARAVEQAAQEIELDGSDDG